MIYQLRNLYDSMEDYRDLRNFVIIGLRDGLIMGFSGSWMMWSLEEFGNGRDYSDGLAVIGLVHAGHERYIKIFFLVLF